MTAPPINLAELRAQAEAQGVFKAGDGQPAVRFADWGEVLALVEAVEAAQAVGKLSLRHHGQYVNKHDVATIDALRAALSPFVAEETE